MPARRRAALVALWAICTMLGSWLRAAQIGELPAVDDKWKRYQSPNFELYSRNDEAYSRDLLYNMELLRSLFIDRFKAVERSRLEVTIYSFRTVEDFRAYAGEDIRQNPRVRGFYLAAPDRAVISLAPADDDDASRRLVFHEYVHHLFRSTGAEPTVWFNEGMAELLAGIQLTGGGVEIGHPLAGRLIALQEEKLLPLETVFEVQHDSPTYRSKDHSGMFYAESWALLHYWYFGQSKIPRASVERFLRVAGDSRLIKKVNLRSFFRECFAMDYPDMVRAVESYARGGTYHYQKQPLPKVAPAASYNMQPVPRELAQQRLADLLVRVGPSPLAEFHLIDAGARTPSDARALEVLGSVALRNLDAELAKQRWEAAIAAGSKNSAVLREAALMEGRQWFENFNYDFRFPNERAERLRGQLAASIQAEPLQTASYEMLAWLEAYAETPIMANINLVQKNFATLQHRDRTLVALSFARVRAGAVKEARSLLEEGLPKLEPDLWSRQTAEEILARLDGRPAQRISEADTRATTIALTPESAGTLRIPSVELPPRPAK